MYSFQQRALQTEKRPPLLAVAFLRKVYLLFTGSVWFAVVGAMLALYAGAPVELTRDGVVVASVPPLVAFAMQHWIVMMLVYIGAFFAASFARHIRGLNVLALFGYAFITGLFIAPSIFVAQAMASAGHTLDASPVRDAFLLSGSSFVGLSAYVLVSRKDFSRFGAAQIGRASDR